MSDPIELLAAINAEAINRMTPAELVDRAVALRAPLHNTLEIEPLDVEGGTLYTVTSGIVTEARLEATTEIEDDEIVRRQLAPGHMTLYADVVELSDNDERPVPAKLFRVEQPFEPVLAEARGSFRDTILEAALPAQGKARSSVHFDDGHHYYSKARETDGETWLDSKFNENNLTRLLALPDAKVSIPTLDTSSMDSEIAVRPTFTGPARVALDPFQLARVTKNTVLVSPGKEHIVSITLPEGTKQHLPENSHNDRSIPYARVPDNATFDMNENGEVIMNSDRAGEEQYRRANLQPYVDAETLAQLIPAEAVPWTDQTNAFLTELAKRIAEALPLNGLVSWERTLARARVQVHEALQTDRKPVLGGKGDRAVAALMAELPPFMKGAYSVDEAFFTRAV